MLPIERGRIGGLLALLRGHRLLYAVSIAAIVARHLLLVVATAAGSVAVGLAATDRRGVAVAAVVALGTLLAAAVASWAENVASHVLSFAVLADLRIGLIGRLGRTAGTGLGRGFGGRRLGDLAATVHDDTERLEIFFAHSSLYVCAAATVSPLVVLAVGTRSLPAAVVLAVALAATLALPALLRRTAHRQGALQRATAAALAVEVGETLGALREVLAFDLVDRQRGRIADAAGADERVRSAAAVRAASEGAAARLAAVLGLLAVAGVLLPDLASGRRDLPEVLGLLGIAAAGPGAVLQLVTVTRHWSGTAAAADRIAGLLREIPAPSTDGVPLPEHPLEVTYQDVEVTRPVPVLRGVAWTAPAGAVTALAGPSGAGKTTALSLLLPGATPDRGRVRVGGVDVMAADRASWQRAVAVVGQDSHLFADTLRANLLLSTPPDQQRTDSDLLAALDAVGARDLVDRLPAGLDTVLADRGGFSGGERQRLALARAVLARPRLLVLDEAFSHLDEDAERRLWPVVLGDEHAERGPDRRTVVLAAHRRSTLDHADRLVLLEDGRTVAEPDLSGTSQPPPLTDQEITR